MAVNGSDDGDGGGVSGGSIASEDPPNKKYRTDQHVDENEHQNNNRAQQQQTNLNKSTDDLRRKRPETTTPNHILHFTVKNSFCKFTVEDVYQNCHPHGKIQRILIFKENVVQAAMVEFDSVEAATKACENLKGTDIFSECCTFEIGYANVEKLIVYKNDIDTSWDYTLAKAEEMGNGHSPLLLLGPGAGFPPYDPPNFYQTTETWKGAPMHPTALMKKPPLPPGRNGPLLFPAEEQQNGSVMMVSGLDEESSNTDKLYNLLCLYGNVVWIKFLTPKEATAMVQMGDSVEVERCVQHLNNIPVGNNGKIQITVLKQNFHFEFINPFSLPDDTSNFKVYCHSKNNRFLTPARASMNRILTPTKTLHFFNVPLCLTKEQLIGIFNSKGVTPTSVRMFPQLSERSSSGLIEFTDIRQAVLAIMKCNHQPIKGKDTKFTFIMKLCFSSVVKEYEFLESGQRGHQEPLYGSRPQPYKPSLLGPGVGFPPYDPHDFHQTTETWKGAPMHPTALMTEPPIDPGRNGPLTFPAQGQQYGAVMLVSGLDEETSNTDKLFNLFCIYGNVVWIKFLTAEEGIAMVRMGDSMEVERCVQHLNNIPVGNNGKIQITVLKQNFQSEDLNPFSLPDHTPSFKEYTESKYNRFLTTAQASKNRLVPPSKMLHFFNAPPELTEEQLIGIFNTKGVPPVSVKMFPLKMNRSSSGVIEFTNIAQAVLAIMMCNHQPIEGVGATLPFILKLRFTRNNAA